MDIHDTSFVPLSKLIELAKIREDTCEYFCDNYGWECCIFTCCICMCEFDYRYHDDECFVCTVCKEGTVCSVCTNKQADIDYNNGYDSPWSIMSCNDGRKPPKCCLCKTKNYRHFFSTYVVWDIQTYFAHKNKAKKSDKIIA